MCDDAVERIRMGFVAVVDWPGNAPPDKRLGQTHVSVTELDGRFSARAWADDNLGRRFREVRADGPFPTRGSALDGLASRVRAEAVRRLRRLESEVATSGGEREERVRRLFAAVFDVGPQYLHHVRLFVDEFGGRWNASVITSEENVGEYHRLGTVEAVARGTAGSREEAVSDIERIVRAEADRKIAALRGAAG